MINSKLQDIHCVYIEKVNNKIDIHDILYRVLHFLYYSQALFLYYSYNILRTINCILLSVGFFSFLHKLQDIPGLQYDMKYYK